MRHSWPAISIFVVSNPIHLLFSLQLATHFLQLWFVFCMGPPLFVIIIQLLSILSFVLFNKYAPFAFAIFHLIRLAHWISQPETSIKWKCDDDNLSHSHLSFWTSDVECLISSVILINWNYTTILFNSKITRWIHHLHRSQWTFFETNGSRSSSAMIRSEL